MAQDPNRRPAEIQRWVSVDWKVVTTPIKSDLSLLTMSVSPWMDCFEIASYIYIYMYIYMHTYRLYIYVESLCMYNVLVATDSCCKVSSLAQEGPLAPYLMQARDVATRGELKLRAARRYFQWDDS